MNEQQAREIFKQKVQGKIFNFGPEAQGVIFLAFLLGINFMDPTFLQLEKPSETLLKSP